MYIGKTPTVGNFQVCDAISVVNGQAAYTLQVGGTNVAPESANHMLVSLNGVLQKPGSSFTISGSTMTFASNLATGDVIDFVQILGNVLDIGQPSDDTVGAAQIKNDLISGTTALASEPADTDEFLVSDAGTLKRIDYSLIKGGGKIGQVVTGTNNGYSTTMSATSFTDVLSASGTTWETAITPTATSSKILVLPAVYVRNHWSGGQDARGTINMMAQIGSGSYAEIDRAYEFGIYDYGGSGNILAGNYTPIQLYTSNTTDEVKIKFQIKAANTSMTIATNWGSGDDVHVSRVTLLEVLA